MTPGWKIRSQSARGLAPEGQTACKTYGYASDLLARDSWNLRNRQNTENRAFSNFPLGSSLRRNFP